MNQEKIFLFIVLTTPATIVLSKHDWTRWFCLGYSMLLVYMVVNLEYKCIKLKRKLNK
jgi:hypothetical protein